MAAMTHCAAAMRSALRVPAVGAAGVAAWRPLTRLAATRFSERAGSASNLQDFVEPFPLPSGEDAIRGRFEAGSAPELPDLPVPARIPDIESRAPHVQHFELNFDDSARAFASRTTGELVRAWFVLTMCKQRKLVEAANPGQVQQMLSWAEQLLGPRAVHWAMKRTFFDHFCGGENAHDLAPVLHRLRGLGVRGILDYAAEADADAGSAEGTQDPAPTRVRGEARARVYDPTSCVECDRHAEVFMEAIETSQSVSPQGFAAIKVTALCRPDVLERFSSAVREARSQATYDAVAQAGGSTVVTRGGLEKFLGCTLAAEDELELFHTDLAGGPAGTAVGISYEDWRERMDLPRVIRVMSGAIQDDDRIMLAAALRRLSGLTHRASELGVGVMVDAEHSSLQPAIDLLALELQRQCNKDRAVVLTTFQCYLKSARRNLSESLSRSRREGWVFGTKLVRGAYMEWERARAGRLSMPSPVHDTYDATSECYHDCLDLVLEEVAQDTRRVEVAPWAPFDHTGRRRGVTALMVASHNTHSVAHATRRALELGIPKSFEGGAEGGGVFYAQLFGMADHVTFTLGQQGYLAYKYVPYGPLREVMPYLLRRAQENGDVLSKVDEERTMLRQEIARRISPV